MGNAQAVMELMHDSNFTEIVRRAKSTSPLWEEFQTHPMPQGYTALEAWSVLTAMRRQTANVFPYPSYIFAEGPTEIWYDVNDTMRLLISEMQTTMRMADDVPADSQAGRFLSLKNIGSDLASALECDGCPVDVARAYDIIARGSIPATPEEQVLGNAFGILRKAHRYAKRSFSPWMFDDIQDMLEQGSGSLDVQPRIPQASCTTIYKRMSDEETIERFCAILNDLSSGKQGDALAGFLLLAGIFRDISPLPRWNNVAILAMRHIFFAKMHMELLCNVPFGALCLRWERGERVAGVPYDWTSCNPDCGEGNDMSIHVQCYLQILHDALDSFVAELLRERSMEKPLDAAVAQLKALNHRQQSVLREIAGENDHAPMSIDAHMKVFGIAYSTARADLLALADAGYLVMETRGKKMLFSARPHLRETLLGTVVERS